MENRTQRLIGLAGAAGAGKTTFARYLQDTHQFAMVGFGDAIKDEVARYLPNTLKEYLWSRGIRPVDEDVIHERLWENRSVFFRAVLQEWGMMRRAQRADYWVTAWLLRARGLQRVVNENVRMRGEAEAIRSLGGRLIKLFRPMGPTLPPALAEDPTEHGLDDWADWDLVVANDGTLDDLRGKANECLRVLWD